MKRQGMALITALLMSVLLLMLGIAFLDYLQRDYRFAAHQEKSQQAYYLALAGLEYQRTRTDLLYPTPAGTNVTRHVPLGDPTHYFVVTVDKDGNIVSKGVVEGGVAVSRILEVKPGRPVREYKDISQ